LGNRSLSFVQVNLSPIRTHLEQSNEEDDSHRSAELVYAGSSHRRMALEFGYQPEQHPEGKKSQQRVPAPRGKSEYG
jgi:hypothetical protein